jgi:hypothetical protein
MIEERDLAPTLSPEAVANYRHLLEALKAATSFHEATAAMLAQPDQQAA